MSTDDSPRDPPTHAAADTTVERDGMTFRPHSAAEADVLDIPPSDEPTDGPDELDWLTAQMASEKCFFCRRRKSPAELEACERESPGRNCPEVK